MKILLCAMLLWGSLIASVKAERLQVFGSEFPPLMYERNGKAQGFYAELLQLMLEQMPHIQIATRFYPVPRMLEMVKTHTNSVALGIARTPDREEQYKWVGPSIRLGSSLYRLKSKHNVAIQAVDDLKPFRISTGQAYAIKEGLLKAGIPKENIVEFQHDVQGVRMLFGQRFDFMAAVDLIFMHLIRQERFNYDQVEAVKLDDVFVTWEMYYAFNKGIDDRVISEFQVVLQAVKESKQYTELTEKYMSE